jgi:hypothetical protein
MVAQTFCNRRMPFRSRKQVGYSRDSRFISGYCRIDRSYEIGSMKADANSLERGR